VEGTVSGQVRAQTIVPLRWGGALGSATPMCGSGVIIAVYFLTVSSNSREGEIDMRQKSFFGLFSAYLFGVALLSGTALTAAAEPEWTNPVIKGYGKVVSLPNAAMQPDKNAEYKIVFNLTPGGDPDKVNASLDRVARAVNIFASAGVPPSRLNMVVVIHGPATPIVLDNAHYQEKFKLDNPNIGLID
jgi:hypothetical protein